MGFLNLFSKKEKPPELMKLPSGSFTLDRDGNVLTSTLPHWFPATYINEISRRVLDSFQAAQRAHIVLSEISVNYAALKVQARELHGGALVFLMPQTLPRHPKLPQPELNHG
jgi:hypothetical protein